MLHVVFLTLTNYGFYLHYHSSELDTPKFYFSFHYMIFYNTISRLYFIIILGIHCVKSMRIWSYSCLHFPTFGLDAVLSPNAGKGGPEQLRIRTLFTQWYPLQKADYAKFWSLMISDPKESSIFDFLQILLLVPRKLLTI